MVTGSIGRCRRGSVAGDLVPKTRPFLDHWPAEPAAAQTPQSHHEAVAHVLVGLASSCYPAGRISHTPPAVRRPSRAGSGLRRTSNTVKERKNRQAPVGSARSGPCLAADVGGDHQANDAASQCPVKQAGGQIPDADGVHGRSLPQKRPFATGLPLALLGIFNKRSGSGRNTSPQELLHSF